MGDAAFPPPPHTHTHTLSQAPVTLPTTHQAPPAMAVPAWTAPPPTAWTTSAVSPPRVCTAPSRPQRVADVYRRVTNLQIANTVHVTLLRAHRRSVLMHRHFSRSSSHFRRSAPSAMPCTRGMSRQPTVVRRSAYCSLSTGQSPRCLRRQTAPSTVACATLCGG